MPEKINNPGMGVGVINSIAKLAKIEKTLTASEKYHQRQGKAKSLLNELYAYLMQHIDAIPPKSLLGKAVSYTLNQWPKLLTYLQDGRLDISNNLSESAIKPFVMGRKAWMFGRHMLVPLSLVLSRHVNTIVLSLMITCAMYSMHCHIAKP